MTGIFISYRREDSGAYAGRLYDALTSYFDRGSLFFDVDTIEPGQDFREVIQRTCSSCKVLLVIIGKQWATACDKSGRLRLNNSNDIHRIEIATALQKGLRVIPVRVGEAEMPDESALPPDLQPLAYRHAFEVSDRRFHQDVQLLVEALKKVLGDSTSKSSSNFPDTSQKTVPRGKSRIVPEAITTPAKRPSLFPLYGIVPGQTTVSELAKKGVRTTNIDKDTGNPYFYYVVNGFDFWYDNKSKIVTGMYLTYTEELPKPWQKLGLDWQNSYNQWVSVFQGLGYRIEIEEPPHIEEYDGHDSLSAEVVAYWGEPHPYQVTLGFRYSEGTTTSSNGTLYSINISQEEE
jgi:hypothetical protein